MSKPSTYWNHRVVRVPDGDDTILMVCEVFYEDGKAIMRDQGARVHGESEQELRQSIERITSGLSKPALEDTWPQPANDEPNPAAGR